MDGRTRGEWQSGPRVQLREWQYDPDRRLAMLAAILGELSDTLTQEDRGMDLLFALWIDHEGAVQ